MNGKIIQEPYRDPAVGGICSSGYRTIVKAENGRLYEVDIRWTYDQGEEIYVCELLEQDGGGMIHGDSKTFPVENHSLKTLKKFIEGMDWNEINLDIWEERMMDDEGD